MARLTGGDVPTLLNGNLAHLFQAPGLTADITPNQAAPANIDRLLAGQGLEVVDQHLIDPLHIQSFASPLGTGIASSGDMHLSVPQPDPSKGVLILKTDLQTGVHEWILPNDDPAPAAVVAMAATINPPGAGPVFHFTIRLSSVSRPAAATGMAASRLSLLGTIGKFVIRTVTYVIPQSWVGAGINAIARNWESNNRKYQMLKVGVTGNAITTSELSPADFKDLQTAPSLLFIHGTFSTFLGGFADLTVAGMQPLLAKYKIVWALNHPTMADSIEDNLSWFFQNLRNNGVGSLKMDIVSHSRGGLLARSLAGQGLQAPVPMDIGKVILGASPNQGTPMADAAHMRDVVNVWTNILDLAAGGAVGIVVDAVMFLVTAIGYAGLKSLKGLAEMAPNSPFLASILQKAPCPATFYAVAADLEEPLNAVLKTPLLWTAYEADQQVFPNMLNDLVVPYNGSYVCAGDANFPISGGQLKQFPNSQSVYHTNLFAQPETIQILNAWL